MFTRSSLTAIMKRISALMTENRDYLIQLDQVNGDGDLGLSMDDGFRALAQWLGASTEDDLGQLLRSAAKVLNDKAPSSLGTIISFGLMGMAKPLRGKTAVEFEEAIGALGDGVRNIMVKAESKPGEKTIVDALVPGVNMLIERAADTPSEAARAAAQAAARGSEATTDMLAVHGRAAYSASRSTGVLDGGSVVGRLIFEGIADYLES